MRLLSQSLAKNAYDKIVDPVGAIAESIGNAAAATLPVVTERHFVGPRLAVLASAPNLKDDLTRMNRWSWHGGSLNTYGWHLNRPRHFEIHGGPQVVFYEDRDQEVDYVCIVDGSQLETFRTVEVTTITTLEDKEPFDRKGAANL